MARRQLSAWQPLCRACGTGVGLGAAATRPERPPRTTTETRLENMAAVVRGCAHTKRR